MSLVIGSGQIFKSLIVLDYLSERNDNYLHTDRSKQNCLNSNIYSSFEQTIIR